MRSIVVATVVFLAPFSLSGAASAAGEAACSGEACGALTVGSDGCSWTNKGEKSVRLAATAGGDGLPVVIVLASGETFKESAERCAKHASGSHYEASFPTLAKMPDEPVAPKKVALSVPKPKPVAAVAPLAAVVSAPATVPVAPTVVVPRAKPSLAQIYPPRPRAKPELPVQAVAVALATPAPEAAVAAPVVAIAPSASAPAPVEAGRASCGEACGEILFTQVDSCLWVQSQNPRPIAFEAVVAGKPVALALEGADGKKADVRAAALAKAGADAAAGEAAYHTRLHDPFQSAGSGIPVYRVRLGGAAACIKARDEIATFSARFAK
ncbi:MAG: hypothetical protein K8S25_13195 [Alphaproteobacteria bacterium]|nr:hypothetical protein [Alphaproteobacteria bacterium]